MSGKSVRTAQKRDGNEHTDSEVREAFEAMMEELHAIPPRVRAGYTLTDDQIAFLRLGHSKGLGFASLAEKGRQIWGTFPSKDWLLRHRHQWLPGGEHE